MSTTVTATNAEEWRAWLAAHGRTEREVWLVIHHKTSPTRSVRDHESIEHARCIGWIDSLARKHEPDSFVLRASRAPSAKSTWSRENRERAARMIDDSLQPVSTLGGRAGHRRY